MFDRTDRYIGVGFIVLGILGFYSATTWKYLFSSDQVGPAAIPKILCVGLIILGVILLVGGLTVKGKLEKVFCTKDELLLVIELAGSCLLYIIFLPVIGYILATPLLLAACMFIVGMRDVKTIVLVSVIGTIILFVLFYSVLRVNLPLGFMKKLIASFMPRI